MKTQEGQLNIHTQEGSSPLSARFDYECGIFSEPAATDVEVSYSRKRSLDSSIVDAFAKLLWVFTAGSRRTRMQQVEYLAETLSFLTDIPVEESFDYIFDILSQQPIEESPKEIVRFLLDSEVPIGRLQQFVLRLLREASCSTPERAELLSLFNSLFCTDLSIDCASQGQMVTRFCYLNDDLSESLAPNVSTKSGRLLFQGKRAASKVDLARFHSELNELPLAV